MRALVLAAALAALGCDRPAGEDASAQRDPARETGQITLNSTAALQDWLMLARTSDGGYVHFNQRSIYRTGDGRASVQVQVRYGEPQLFRSETDTSETTIRYTVERIAFSFKCDEGAFYTGERQIIDDADVVQATIPAPPEIYRPVQARGIAALIMPTACRGT